MSKFQYPKINDDKVFENFICDLFNNLGNTNDYSNSEFQLFGKNGQSQKGIDIISQKHKTAIQCKCIDTTIDSFEKIRKRLKSEIEKDLTKAKLLNFKIDRLIFTSTFINDTQLQEYTLELKNKENLNFTVEYWGWETITNYAEKYDKLIKTYFFQNLPEYHYTESPNDLITKIEQLGYSKKLSDLRNKLFLDKQYKELKEIELVNIDIDTANCSWYKDEDYETVFWDTNSKKSPFPIFDFCILNNCKTTIILKSIKCKYKHLYSGLQGLPYPTVVKSLTQYDLFIDTKKENNKVETFDPIQIPSEQAVRFCVQVLLGLKESQEFEQFRGRNTLNFIFEFNDKKALIAPEILLNTTNNADTIEIRLLS